MNPKQIPPEEVLDVHVSYGRKPGDATVVHIGVKTLVIEGSRIQKGQLVEAPLPYLDTSCVFSVIGTRKSPKGVDVLFGFLVTE